MDSTRRFFDGMARHYDKDLQDVGWDPIDVLRKWPFLVQPGERYVDAGCGTGAVLDFFSGANRELTGLDLSPEMVAHAKRRRALREAEVYVQSLDEPWPIEDEVIDVVTCLAALEFVEEIDKPLDEIARVLRPGGRAFITVEGRADWEGETLSPQELRYDEFPLWRRDRDEVEMAIPLELETVKYERIRAYTLLETGVTFSYHAYELRRVS